MGKFANELEGVGTKVPGFDAPPRQTKDGYDALGLPVPAYRQTAGYRYLKDDIGLSTERAMECVGLMSEAIARDDPHHALERGFGFIDATGCYVLLATLLTAAKPRVRFPAA